MINFSVRSVLETEMDDFFIDHEIGPTTTAEFLAYIFENINFFEKIVNIKNISNKIIYKKSLHHFSHRKRIWDVNRGFIIDNKIGLISIAWFLA